MQVIFYVPEGERDLLEDFQHACTREGCSVSKKLRKLMGEAVNLDKLNQEINKNTIHNDNSK